MSDAWCRFELQMPPTQSGAVYNATTLRRAARAFYTREQRTCVQASMKTPCGIRASAEPGRDSACRFNDVLLRNAISGGTVKVAGRAKGPILTDTRRPDVPGAWFIALEGPLHDGHDFVLDSIDKGASGVIVSKQWLDSGTLSAEVLQRASGNQTGVVAVPDTTLALAQLCRHAMSRYCYTVIAVTGSCGKTTCKSMVSKRKPHIWMSITCSRLD